ncbi:MAG: OsmC family protein [Acidimicrobiales bacterium]
MAEARWESGYRADIAVRQFRFVADEPPRSGGEDAGAMPTEYLLVALSSCYAMALAHVARKREVALGPLTVKAVATYDGSSFSAIDLDVVFGQGPPEAVEALVERASRVCYVSNTLRRAPQLTVTVTPG